MPIVIDIAELGPPKAQIIEMAFSEAGSAGYEFGRTPEEVADALLRLNALMAEWEQMKGIRLGYEQPTYGVGRPEDASGIPFHTLNTVASFLALRICPLLGATLSPDAKGNLNRSLALLEAHYAAVPVMPYDNKTPRGAGNQTGLYYGPYIYETFDMVNPAAAAEAAEQAKHLNPLVKKEGAEMLGLPEPAAHAHDDEVDEGDE